MSSRLETIVGEITMKSNKRKFFDTRFATISGLSSQLPRVIKYVVENRNAILSPGDLMTLAQPIRTILKTPMAEFFERLLSGQKFGNFAAIYIPPKEQSVPELLTASSVVLDLKQLPDTSVISSMPMLKDKVIINLTSLLKQDRQTGNLVVNAVDNFQNHFVRGHLVASYNDSDGWLSPYLADYTIKTYSMILSGLISRFYNLTLTETLRVMGILALYMSQMLSRDNDDLVCPNLFNRCTFIGSRAELMSIAESCAHLSAEGLTMESTCQLISEIGTDKIRKFDLRAFVAFCGNLGPDAITSQIALEYPPYWLYMLILALSGAKLPIIFQMNSQRLTQEGRSKFLQQLIMTESVFDVDRR